MLFYLLSGLGIVLTALLFLLAPGLSLWWAVPIALGMILLCNLVLLV